MITTMEHAFFLATGQELEAAKRQLVALAESVMFADVTRGDDGCMPGKGGKCVLCGTGDCLRRPE